MRVLIAAMVVACSAKTVAEPLDAMGTYEREAVVSVLETHALRIELKPEGKRIRNIRIVNLDVFGPKTKWLRNLNRLHKTSDDSSVRLQLLVQPGEIWNEARVRETERIIRNPSLSSFVVAVPIEVEAWDEVDLLLVTRDVWSLRTNSEFVHQDGTLSFLKVAAAENNLFGRRKHLSLILEMDQGEYSLSTRWRDLNVGGTRWQMVVRPRILFGRASNDVEGSQSFVRLTYPLWSLASRWGWNLEATHKNSIIRNFEGPRLATYDAPETEDIETLPQKYRLRQQAIRTQVSRSFGRWNKHTVSFGHEWLSSRPKLLPLEGLDGEVGESFRRALLPRSERSSAITAAFDFFRADYVTYRNINGYDLPEVKSVGPTVHADIALALTHFGSERGFARSSARAGYLFDLDADGLVEIGASVGRRFEHDASSNLDSVDTTYGADWFVASPVLRSLRLVSFGVASLRNDVKDNEIVQIGGQEDLRGYAVGAFRGTSFYRASVELRTLPTKLSFMRVGYVAFWDIGDAANSPNELTAHQNVGVGVKALIPQTGESLLSFYWAVPMDRGARSFPGRISIGLGKEL